MAEVMAWPLNLKTYQYNAEDVMRWMAGKTSGVYGQEGNWRVSHKSGMTVTVKAENMLGGWLSNMGKYGVGFWNSADIDLAVSIGDGTNPRIDRVVVSWHIPNQSELPVVEIRKGAPSSAPAAPDLVNDGEYVEICIAEISVPAGATDISDANITDTRMDESLCGIVSMGVEKFPTDGLYDEFISWENSSKAEFEEWFENLKAQLDDNIASNLQQQITDLKEYAESRPYTEMVTAYASGWSEEYPSQNVVSVPNAKPGDLCNIIIGLDNDTATDEQRETERKAVISPTAQAKGSVTLKAYGTKPDKDLPLVAFIFYK